MCIYLFYSDYFAKFAYHNNKRTGNYIGCMLKLNFKFLLLMYSKSILVTFALLGVTSYGMSKDRMTVNPDAVNTGTGVWEFR